MNAMINEASIGMRDDAEKLVLTERNARADLHRMGTPAEWGWRRPTPDELISERLAGLERMLDELG